MAFSRASRGRLTAHDLGRFPGETLFDRIGRAVCQAGCLPRKELFESWEMARRVRRIVRGRRVVDLCGGHGVLSELMLLLDDSSPCALVVDTNVPPSAARVHEALLEAWPRLQGRVVFHVSHLDTVRIDAGDIVVSSHACGNLTDRVLERAAEARASVAVLPCCHEKVKGTIERRTPHHGDARPETSADGVHREPAAHGRFDPTSLEGWVDRALAIDVERALWLQRQDYRVRTQTIPPAITPKNRLLIGVPQEQRA
jgi:hypothetical protein